jgi:hypothetical protein
MIFPLHSGEIARTVIRRLLYRNGQTDNFYIENDIPPYPPK